ncbi:MAG TPA: sporulation protein [Firmicutes bacterium]|jgi:uncharacterized YkwD family protein|nr:sporulation protein [Bacillota bacterium]
MQKIIWKYGILLGILSLSIVYAGPVYGYQGNSLNWHGWPIPGQRTGPSIPRYSKPVQNPVSGVGTGNHSSVQVLTLDESYILKQVNIERTKVGLGVLQIDNRLEQTARAKSMDMIKGGYFGHQSPTLGSPFDQMKRAGISYHWAGENIAGNFSAAGAMKSWMNSSGHRANILNPNFSRIGIGVIDGGPYGKMLTQQFIG